MGPEEHSRSRVGLVAWGPGVQRIMKHIPGPWTPGRWGRGGGAWAQGSGSQLLLAALLSPPGSHFACRGLPSFLRSRLYLPPGCESGLTSWGARGSEHALGRSRHPRPQSSAATTPQRLTGAQGRVSRPCDQDPEAGSPCVVSPSDITRSFPGCPLGDHAGPRITLLHVAGGRAPGHL